MNWFTRLLHRPAPDAVERQLQRLASQGNHSARLAHACAFLLIVLFSLGSLVSLSGDALAAILRQWHAGGALDIPAAISVGVSTCLVVAMDVGMLHAASVLRMLTARRADASEKRQHQLVMGAVAILEASTYAYMSSIYDAPHSLAAWALILARAGAAPFLAVYLSMARPLPVERRDILAAAALASGAGVLRDVTQLANDATAPLARKITVYKAADYQPGRSDEPLDRLIAALAPASDGEGVRTTPTMPADAPDLPHTRTQEGAGALLAFPGTDVALGDLTAASANVAPPVSVPAGRVEWLAEATTGEASLLLSSAPRRSSSRKRQKAYPRRVRTVSSDSYEALARQAFATGATSIPKMMRETGMGRAAAQSWVRALKAEKGGTYPPAQSDQDGQDTPDGE